MSELDKRKFKVELICAIVIIVSIGITYAASVLNVSNNTKQAAAVFDTQVESIEVSKTNGAAQNDTSVTKVNGLALVFGASLPKQGDSITYLVTIKNGGNIDAYTSGLTVGKFIDGVQKASVYPLDAQYEGITSDELIPAGTTKTFTVTLSYEKSDVVLTNSKLTYTIFLKFIQK